MADDAFTAAVMRAFDRNLQALLEDKHGVVAAGGRASPCPCTMVSHPDATMELTCGGYEFAVFVRRGCPISDAMVEFMEKNEASFVAIDVDSVYGRELEFLIAFDPGDIPLIYSTVSGKMVWRKTVPDSMEDLYV